MPDESSFDAGLLMVAATPLGNPGDATSRLREALATADAVAAEDTRRTRRLAAVLDVTIAGQVISYYDATEAARVPELLERLRRGERVLLVSDAGMPGVSDPGYRLVAAARDEGLPVTVLPGPSAVTTALVLSGLPSDRFCFEGFPPRKAGERAARLAELATEPRTMVFFEAPHRVAACLEAMSVAFGPERQAALCRELTKTYEETRRGTLAELAAWAAGGVRGEITLVVGGAPARAAEPVDDAELARLVAEAEAAGTHRKTAIADVARAHGLPKRRVYDAVLAAKDPS